MRVYIDFDDVICETAKHFCCIAKELFDIDLPYQEVQFFNLKKSFDWFNTKLTGIDARTVAGAPTFPELWKKIEPILSSGVLVAHNASFDMGVLKKCLKDYNIQWKSAVPYCCTVQIGRRVLPEISHKLNNVCDHYGICLDHHRADSDSTAAAKILLRYMEKGTVISDFVKEYML